MEEKKHAKRNRNIILVAVIIIVVALVLRTWYYRDYYLFKGLIQSDRFDAIIAEQILENPKFWTDEDGELKNILEGTKFKRTADNNVPELKEKDLMIKVHLKADSIHGSEKYNVIVSKEFGVTAYKKNEKAIELYIAQDCSELLAWYDEHCE